MEQVAVVTAFLEADTEEEIYMKQPEGFVTPTSMERSECACRRNHCMASSKLLGTGIRRQSHNG
jgi:hypothetical protein